MFHPVLPGQNARHAGKAMGQLRMKQCCHLGRGAALFQGLHANAEQGAGVEAGDIFCMGWGKQQGASSIDACLRLCIFYRQLGFFQPDGGRSARCSSL